MYDLTGYLHFDSKLYEQINLNGSDLFYYIILLPIIL